MSSKRTNQLASAIKSSLLEQYSPSTTMCILFFHFDPAHPGYIFIVASNRDEWYDRPTETVSFWEDRPLICAGKYSSVSRGNHIYS